MCGIDIFLCELVRSVWIFSGRKWWLDICWTQTLCKQSLAAISVHEDTMMCKQKVQNKLSITMLLHVSSSMAITTVPRSAHWKCVHAVGFTDSCNTTLVKEMEQVSIFSWWKSDFYVISSLFFFLRVMQNHKLFPTKFVIAAFLPTVSIFLPNENIPSLEYIFIIYFRTGCYLSFPLRHTTRVVDVVSWWQTWGYFAKLISYLILCSWDTVLIWTFPWG